MNFYFEKDNRFYILELSVDIFGKPCIIKTWGSLKSKWERKAEVPVEKGKDPKELILKLVTKRKARGYKFIQTPENHRLS
jgi:phage terminase large subunit-like protein